MADQKITVMIVDDVEQTRVDIKRLLYFEDDIAVLGEAADGIEAVRLAKEIKPEVILMDINMPGIDGIEATEQICSFAPQTSIVIISIQGEMEYLRKAMVAGARDYLVKPFTSDQLSQTIRKVAMLNAKRQQAQPKATAAEVKKESHIRCLYSPAGGAGKSVLAVNLAVLLAQNKKDVALLDNDLQFGSIAENLNLKPERTWEDLAAIEDIAIEDLSSFLMPHFSGVKVLASPAKPLAEEIVTSELIGQTLDTLQQHFDELIVDLPTALTEKTVEVMERSSEIYVILTPDLASIRKVKSCLEAFQVLDLSSKTILLLNRCDQPEALKLSAIEKVLGMAIAYSFPCAEKLLLNSVNRGIPFVLNQGTAEIALALAKMVQGEPKNPQKRGIMSFF